MENPNLIESKLSGVLKTFINKLNFYNTKNPLDLSSIKDDYENMTYLELSEACRQVELKMELIKKQYTEKEALKLKIHSLFLINLYSEIMEKINSLIPKNYFNFVEVDCSGPLDYPFSDSFKGIEYEAYLELVSHLNLTNEITKEDFCIELDKIMDPWWGKITPTGFLETKNVEENRKTVISLIYDLSPHKTLLKEICRYIQENYPNDRGLSFVKFLVSWITNKNEQLNPCPPSNQLNSENVCNCNIIGGCEDCLEPLIKDHPAYKDCKEDECRVCSIRDCPHGSADHYFHDGCTICYVDKTDKVK